MPEKTNVKPLRTITSVLDGTRRDLLVALRDHLWNALYDPRTQPRDLSPLSLRLLELQKEIETIDQVEEPPRRSPVTDRSFDPSLI